MAPPSRPRASHLRDSEGRKLTSRSIKYPLSLRHATSAPTTEPTSATTPGAPPSLGHATSITTAEPTSVTLPRAPPSLSHVATMTTAEHHLRQELLQPAHVDNDTPRLRPPIGQPLASSRDIHSGQDSGTLREGDTHGSRENVLRPSGSGESLYLPELPQPASLPPLHRPSVAFQSSPDSHLIITNPSQDEDTDGSMINRRDGQPVQQISEQIDLTVDTIKDSLLSLKNSVMLAQRIPYISEMADLLLQVLTTQTDTSQRMGKWGATTDKVRSLAALVSNVGRACENHHLEEDDLPHNLLTIFQSLVTELIRIEHSVKKKGSIFLGVYVLWKIKKYDRKISNLLQALHATLAFNQRLSHCAERIEVKVTNVNTRYDEDQTPLHVASQLGQLETMRSLIARGANLNSENAIKETPLFMASRNGNAQTTQLLLENKANVNHSDLDKRTPLHEASENGHDSVAWLLLTSKANCNAKNMYQWTPLHLASHTGKSAVVQVLLNRGAEINVENVSKWNPLHMASRKGHVEVVKLLLARNARVDDKTEDGETALHLAAYYGHVDVVGLLISHNADQSIWNNERETALELAREQGHENVVQLIEARIGGNQRMENFYST